MSKRRDLPGVVGDGCVPEIRDFCIKRGAENVRFQKRWDQAKRASDARREADPLLYKIKASKTHSVRKNRKPITLPKLKCLESEQEDT